MRGGAGCGGPSARRVALSSFPRASATCRVNTSTALLCPLCDRDAPSARSDAALWKAVEREAAHCGWSEAVGRAAPSARLPPRLGHLRRPWPRHRSQPLRWPVRAAAGQQARGASAGGHIGPVQREPLVRPEPPEEARSPAYTWGMGQCFLRRHRAVCTILLVLCACSVTRAGQQQQDIFKCAATSRALPAGDQYGGRSI